MTSYTYDACRVCIIKGVKKKERGRLDVKRMNYAKMTRVLVRTRAEQDVVEAIGMRQELGQK